jgi:serine/threonine-protein kinase
MDRIGRYRIVRELGRGAMGVVYHAIDPHIGRPVAIKTIQLGALRKPEEQERLRERLFREARSAGILSHPGIVTIYDVDQQGDLAYIAMEYVDGPTLDELLSGDQPISAEKMFSILGQTAAALDYAHQKGIVHRDIKPANIMIASGGRVKITDFGIAKVTASDQFTMTGSIVGTPHYMSPEQVQGRGVDGRSDQFSLAVIAYEMLTGEKPYTGEHLTTVVYKIVSEDPLPPHRLNPTVGAPIEGVLRKALSKKSDTRYDTCQEFSVALERACASTAGWKTMLRGGSLNDPTVTDAPRPGGVTLPPPRRPVHQTSTVEQAASRKSHLLTFILAILAVAGILALISTRVNVPGKELPKTESHVDQQPPPKSEPPATVAEQPPAKADAPAADQAPNGDKPSPMPVAPENQSPTVSQPDQRLAEVPQLVHIVTTPSGASATLDGRPDVVCKTPCSLEASPGRHNLAITLPTYQVEHRPITVGSEALELPVITLRPIGGTVMLTSVPSGAAVLVDGRKTGQTTPAQLMLSTGNYTIGVEKDGKQATQTVEVRNGISFLKLVLE